MGLAGKDIPPLILNAQKDRTLREIARIPTGKDTFVGGATAINGTGQWFETQENVIIVSTIVEDSLADKVYLAMIDIARDLKRDLYQESVLLTARTVKATFV